MSLPTVTACFLTASGWRQTEDRVAVWDREVWPAGTLLAGTLERDPVTGHDLWVEHWRDPWQKAELAEAFTRFGTVPAALEPAAV